MKGMSRFYQECTQRTIQAWEKALKDNPNAEWNCNKIKEILPFLKKVMSRIGRDQSLLGFSIICLASKPRKKEDEERIVRYGLEPLLKAKILTETEAKRIVQWFLKTKPTWDSGGAGHFTKEFQVDGTKYRLITDSYRDYRDLNLQVLN
jgi:hypothetical protein